MRLLWLLLALSACRFSWSAWQGTPPRPANNITVALYAIDETALAMARSALARDPRIAVIDIHPAALAAENEQCGGRPCMYLQRAACTWAAQGGAHYYALAHVDASFGSRFECTRTRGGILDRKEECVAGHTTGEHTSAAFTYDVYDATTCEQVRSLSQRITELAPGPEENSKPEALAQLAQRVAATFQAIPEQLAVDASGRANADDGLYALYRDKDYRGYVRVRRGEMTSLHCCTQPSPGDVLVARGTRRTVEFAVPIGVVALDKGSERETGATLGFGVRYHPLAGGLRFGAGWNMLSHGDARVHLLAPELGWGIRVHSALQLSANLAAGAAWATNGFDEYAATAAPRLHALATLRAETYFATWAYLGIDAGYVRTGTFDDWDNGMYDGGNVRARSPLVRLWFGLDL